MTITVTPEVFNYVWFDAEVIRSIATGLVDALGMSDYDVIIDVDETTPLSGISCEIGETIHIRACSGAFEDTRKPRQQSETATATSIGRVLLRARDRLVGGFGEAPADNDLSLAQVAAWETYSLGRLDRLGVPTNQQRWRYNFRNRLGFTDATDGAFEKIWGSDGLTWGDLCAISETAIPSAAK